jgi:hypothetical protein
LNFSCIVVYYNPKVHLWFTGSAAKWEFSGWEFSLVIYPGSTPVGNATLVVANVLTCNKHSQYCKQQSAWALRLTAVADGGRGLQGGGGGWGMGELSGSVVIPRLCLIVLCCCSSSRQGMADGSALLCLALVCSSRQGREFIKYGSCAQPPYF